jgi:hypothetical protein
MKEKDYPSIFELTPTEQWFIDEVSKAAKRFKKRFF